MSQIMTMVQKAIKKRDEREAEWARQLRLKYPEYNLLLKRSQKA